MLGRVVWILLIGVSTLSLIGCNQKSGSKESEVELPAWMSEGEQARTAKAEIRLASETPSAFLGLNLKVGDQFPLRKVVQQELTQQSLSGPSQPNYSRLEILLAIQVREKIENKVKLAVRYDRVKYQHQLADEKVEFDSQQASQETPPSLQAYRDMIHDGFSFWIGQDNQIVEVEGLSEFVARALRNVPQKLRENVALGIEAGAGDSGIANFVDNTIGLLPYGRKTSPGDSWERQQHVGRPLPMHMNNVYTLKELSDKYAVIDVRGTITPSTTIRSKQEASDVNVIVNGGSILGSCTIFRDTGLPKESRIDRVVEMTAVLANSVQFRQTKRVMTTIESFPMESTGTPTVVGAPPRSGVIQQVSGTR